MLLHKLYPKNSPLKVAGLMVWFSSLTTGPHRHVGVGLGLYTRICRLSSTGGTSAEDRLSTRLPTA